MLFIGLLKPALRSNLFPLFAGLLPLLKAAFLLSIVKLSGIQKQGCPHPIMILIAQLTERQPHADRFYRDRSRVVSHCHGSGAAEPASVKPAGPEAGFPQERQRGKRVLYRQRQTWRAGSGVDQGSIRNL